MSMFMYRICEWLHDVFCGCAGFNGIDLEDD